jgi:hypothetical protein
LVTCPCSPVASYGIWKETLEYAAKGYNIKDSLDTPLAQIVTHKTDRSIHGSIVATACVGIPCMFLCWPCKLAGRCKGTAWLGDEKLEDVLACNTRLNAPAQVSMKLTQVLPEPSAADQQEAAKQGDTAGESLTLQVQVPAGVSGGQLLQVMAPDGRQVQVQVPNGVSPGQIIQVQVWRVAWPAA